MSPTAAVTPFKLDVPDDELADLRERLVRTRWPDAETVDDISQGPQLAKVKALVEHWRDRYDWRACETLLNDLGQYTVTIDGLSVHFLHIRSSEPGALPLLLCHGWPGSVLEFRHLIGPLTDPTAHGGDASDAFDLIIPSMPGFGFSDTPKVTGWDMGQIADTWIQLMSVLGYERWGAQGGDFGAAVCDEIAKRQPAGFVGMHLNLATFQPEPAEMAQASREEQAMLADGMEYMNVLSGYYKLQATRPQTIGYALEDSPVGLAAWIYAMFQDVSGTRGDAEASFDVDEMLDDIMLYWLPRKATSSARLYWEAQQGRTSPPSPQDPTPVATGFTMLPFDHVRKSLRWLQRRYTNIVRFNTPAAGGHFAALEQPHEMTADIRATFRGLR